MALRELEHLPRGTAKLIESRILPYISEQDRRNFFQYTLPAALQHKPTPAQLKQTLQAIHETLPHIPEQNRWRFFQYALPAVLEHNPTAEQWKTIHETLPHIPKQDRRNFFEYGLPAVLEHNPTAEQWKTIHETLPHIPEQDRWRFFQYALPAILQHNPTLEQLKQTIQAIHETLPHIPEQHRSDFFADALSEVLQDKPTVEHWKAIRKTLPHIPEQHRWRFFAYALPRVLQHKPTVEHWEAIHETLPHIPKQHRLNFFAEGVPLALWRGLKPAELKEQGELAQGYFNKLGGTDYAGKVVTENFGRLAPPGQTVNRLSFEKTDSELIPLGGKLTGHLIRIVEPKAFEAWRKAHEAGIPVEPLLYDAKGKLRVYRTKDGLVRVYTRAVGENLSLHLEQHPEHREELEKQQRGIFAKLSELNIAHGHTHDRNFTVTTENGKLKLHLIDWDQATSK